MQLEAIRCSPHGGCARKFTAFTLTHVPSSRRSLQRPCSPGSRPRIAPCLPLRSAALLSPVFKLQHTENNVCNFVVEGAGWNRCRAMRRGDAVHRTCTVSYSLQYTPVAKSSVCTADVIRDRAALLRGCTTLQGSLPAQTRALNSEIAYKMIATLDLVLDICLTGGRVSSAAKTLPTSSAGWLVRTMARASV